MSMLLDILLKSELATEMSPHAEHFSLDNVPPFKLYQAASALL